MAKRIVLLLVLGGLGLGGVWAGWQWWSAWRFEESTDNAYVKSDITAIAAKVAGHVQRIEAAENQRVEAGQVLLRIDDRDYRARVDEAAAAAAARQAEIAHLGTRIEVQHTVIASARATRAGVEAEVKRARQELERSQRLVRDDYASRQRLESDQAALSKAEASLLAAEAAVAGAEGTLEVLRSERAVSDANLRRAEATLAAAQADLDATVVRAPVAGIVGNKAVQHGQFVRAGALLMAVVPLADVWVEANFKETQIGRIRAGAPVAIAVDAFPGRPVAGAVESFAPASGAEFSLLPPENASGNFTKVVQRIPVRIKVPADNPLAGLLRPGMSVVVTVDARAAP